MQSLHMRVYKEKSARRYTLIIKCHSLKSSDSNICNNQRNKRKEITMNKMAIITGEIATGPGLGHRHQ